MVKHLAFKARLRSFLYGNTASEGPLRDPDLCMLGQWIADRRRGAYAQVPEMATFDAEHRHIHQQANQLMDMHLAGRRAEAQAGFAEVQHTAEVMVVLLQTIEARVRTAGISNLPA